MKNKSLKFQFALGFLILILIYFFYFYFPSEKQKKISNKINKIDKDQIIESQNKNIFENVEYISTDTTGKKIVTQATKSFFLQNRPEIIYLENPISFTFMKDGTILKITSEKGEFNKITRDAIYQKNVIITNKDYVINCYEATYTVKENKIKLDGNVIIQDPPNKIFSDKATLDTNTNYTEAFMDSKERRVLSQKFKKK